MPTGAFFLVNSPFNWMFLKTQYSSCLITNVSIAFIIRRMQQRFPLTSARLDANMTPKQTSQLLNQLPVFRIRGIDSSRMESFAAFDRHRAICALRRPEKIAGLEGRAKFMPQLVATISGGFQWRKLQMGGGSESLMNVHKGECVRVCFTWCYCLSYFNPPKLRAEPSHKHSSKSMPAFPWRISQLLIAARQSLVC